jgi:transposase
MEKIKTRTARCYAADIRQSMIDTYLRGGYTKREVWEMFTGEPTEHGKITDWMRALGYDTKNLVFGTSPQPIPMPTSIPVENTPLSSEHLTEPTGSLPDESDLFARIQYLEKALEMSKLKEEGYALMIDLAEKELSISIRKK